MRKPEWSRASTTPAQTQRRQFVTISRDLFRGCSSNELGVGCFYPRHLIGSAFTGRHAVNDHRFSRRYFFYGTLLAGAVPSGGFGSTASLSALGYKSPTEKLNIGAVGLGTRGPAILTGAAA